MPDAPESRRPSMLDVTAGPPAGVHMTVVEDVASLVEIQPESTVSRTILKAEGVRVVLFAFDAGQVLTEHTAAVPIMIRAATGHLRITADGRTVDLRPGAVIHMGTRLPHSVEAVEPSTMVLVMLDPR